MPGNGDQAVSHGEVAPFEISQQGTWSLTLVKSVGRVGAMKPDDQRARRREPQRATPVMAFDEIRLEFLRHEAGLP
jgi:hypothetical protein